MMIPACGAREPHTPAGPVRQENDLFFSVSSHSSSLFLHSIQTFRSNIHRRTRSQKNSTVLQSRRAPQHFHPLLQTEKELTATVKRDCPRQLLPQLSKMVQD